MRNLMAGSRRRDSATRTAGRRLRRAVESDSRARMRQVNLTQKAYYESRFGRKEQRASRKIVPAANWVTNLWAFLRATMLAFGREVGVGDRVLSQHGDWLEDLGGKTVLDLGCFEGNQLSLSIAERCGSYIGLDLSEKATAALTRKLEARNLANARAIAGDLLDGALPADSVDVVYAQGVLHHFSDFEEALKELARIMRPGGVIVTVDPMMTEPVNRFFRILYRPFQSNAAWEWPFTRASFRLIERYFEIDEMQGYFGMARLGFPFMAIPGLRRLGRAVSRRGAAFDDRHASQFGLPFYFCWKVTMKLRVRKPLP